MSDVRGKSGDELAQAYSLADRAKLITYLQYAVDDVAELNETSAALLRMAITHLAGADSLCAFDGRHKLS